MANIKRWLKRTKIDAINDKELKKLLLKSSLIDPDLEKTLKCYVCEKDIHFDDISAVVLKKGVLSVVCQTAGCIKTINQDNQNE